MRLKLYKICIIVNNYGKFFTKNEPQVKPIITHVIKRQYEPSENNIREIIEKYEHIKNTKNIKDINKLIDVIKNTDWDKTILTNNLPEPSAPLIVPHIHIPIAVAHVIKPNELIK